MGRSFIGQIYANYTMIGYPQVQFDITLVEEYTCYQKG